MRIVVALELEITEGHRTGTVYSRAERAAESLASWAGRLRPVASVHRVSIHPAAALDLLGPATLHIAPVEAWQPQDFTGRVAQAKHAKPRKR